MLSYDRSQPRSSQWIDPRRAATLTCDVTRPRPARSSGSRRPVRAKWPRWLVPSCSSNPSAVTCRSGGVITPALLISRWIGSPSARRRSASAATDASDDRSRSWRTTRAPGTCSRTRSTAASPLVRLRTGISTSAPAPARAAAMPRPIPSLAPVTTARLPSRSGRVRSYCLRGTGAPRLVVGVPPRLPAPADPIHGLVIRGYGWADRSGWPHDRSRRARGLPAPPSGGTAAGGRRAAPRRATAYARPPTRGGRGPQPHVHRLLLPAGARARPAALGADGRLDRAGTAPVPRRARPPLPAGRPPPTGPRGGGRPRGARDAAHLRPVGRHGRRDRHGARRDAATDTAERRTRRRQHSLDGRVPQHRLPLVHRPGLPAPAPAGGPRALLTDVRRRAARRARRPGSRVPRGAPGRPAVEPERGVPALVGRARGRDPARGGQALRPPRSRDPRAELPGPARPVPVARAAGAHRDARQPQPRAAAAPHCRRDHRRLVTTGAHAWGATASALSSQSSDGWESLATGTTITGHIDARRTVRAREPRCSGIQPLAPRRPITTREAFLESSTRTSAGHWCRTSTSTGTVGQESRWSATAAESSRFCCARHSASTRRVMMSSYAASRRHAWTTRSGAPV